MRLLAALFAALNVAVFAGQAYGHWRPRIAHHNASHAVRLAWCGQSNTWCAGARQAWTVAACESHWWPWAQNGQYLGMFQMGAWARARYGHANNPWGQARAAHRYWLHAGWSPWECRP